MGACTKQSWAVDYEDICRLINDGGVDDQKERITKMLGSRWCTAYRKSTAWVPDICRVGGGETCGGFVFLFDDPCEELQPKNGRFTQLHSRVVAVYGRSHPMPYARDDYRLRGWIGPTNSMFGSKWDKGHFIGHSIGGHIDRCELNVFVQRRDLNRGWSQEGRRFRQMERHCSEYPGTFCFHRPIYAESGDRPEFLEFGLVMPDRTLWIEMFDNR